MEKNLHSDTEVHFNSSSTRNLLDEFDEYLPYLIGCKMNALNIFAILLLFYTAKSSCVPPTSHDIALFVRCT